MSDTTSSTDSSNNGSSGSKVWDDKDSDSKDSRAEKELKKCLKDYSRNEPLLKRRLRWCLFIVKQVAYFKYLRWKLIVLYGLQSSSLEYVCAWYKDKGALLQGHMYMTPKCVCFYSNILGYETKVSVYSNNGYLLSIFCVVGSSV